jgi:hypothetical protein
MAALERPANSAGDNLTGSSARTSPSTLTSNELPPSGGSTRPETASTLSVKRKLTDANLETITIDQYYDLALIVGTPDHPDGQKAFRVNRGSMRYVSHVWTNMLEGDWAERKRSEIELPDDPCRAFEIVLYTAHWNFPMLPPALNVRELAELAVLTDRYDLIRVMHIALEVKEWLLPHKKTWIKWSPNPDLQDFVMMTLFFSRSTEFDFLLNRLAVEVQVDEQNCQFSIIVEEMSIGE